MVSVSTLLRCARVTKSLPCTTSTAVPAQQARKSTTYVAARIATRLA